MVQILGVTTFRGAILDGLDLSGSFFESANLSGTLIYEVNFTGAFLHRVNLTNTTISQVVLGDVDLRDVHGLETVDHMNPSILGIDTIYRSAGNIPEAFLRGVGVPDEMITYIKSLVGRPSEFYSCFISYSSKD